MLHREDPITVNIATGKAIAFKEVAEIIYKSVHGITIPVKTQTDEPEGAGHRVGSTKKLNSLGLSCDTSLEYGIRKMVEWSQE